MIRPCFLVIDQEYSGSISSRKLVLETAKFNVITAYSGAEAIETLQRFPSVDGIVLNSGIFDMSCTEVIRQLRQIRADLRIIVVENPGHPPCEGADSVIEPFKPEILLETLRKLEPEKSEFILRQEKDLGANSRAKGSR